MKDWKELKRINKKFKSWNKMKTVRIALLSWIMSKKTKTNLKFHKFFKYRQIFPTIQNIRTARKVFGMCSFLKIQRTLIILNNFLFYDFVGFCILSHPILFNLKTTIKLQNYGKCISQFLKALTHVCKFKKQKIRPIFSYFGCF